MRGPWCAATLRRVLALALVLLGVGGVAGCSFPGTAAPTATAQPTATGVPATIGATATALRVAVTTPSVAPSPPLVAATGVPTVAATATVMATATLRPTVTAVPTMRPETPGTPGGSPLGATRVVRDAQQACELDIPASFVAMGTPGMFASADGRVTIALQALELGPGEAFDDLALPFVGDFITTVGGYRQTSVIRLADDLRIDFTGNRPGPGSGTIYLHQFGAMMCVMTLFVGDDANVAYDAFAGALIAGLRPKGVG